MRVLGPVFAVCLLLGQAVSGLPALAVGSGAPTVVQPLQNDISPALRTMHASPVPPSGKGNQSHRPLRPGQSGAKLPTAPGSIQTMAGAASMPATSTNFEGINNIDGVLPPDTNGDVGPNNYVQWVNLHFEIFDRTGTAILGPSPGNTLWSGFGAGTAASLCDTTNQGDPVVRYDRLASRWVFTQFAFSVIIRKGAPVPSPPFIQCFAVSTTGDPTGSYYRYAWNTGFVGGVNYFPDYPKLAVWPDAYYMTVNYFSGSTFVGGGALAFDRSQMLNGQPATAIGFGPLGSAYGGSLPSDLDGSILPPSGSPNYFGAIDTNVSPSGSTFQIWKFHVDFATPSNSTFGVTSSHTPNFNLPVATYFWNMCNGSRSCVQQPGTSVGLDAISDRLMNRLQYRRFADGRESLVANHTVGVGSGNNQAAIRWYEIRNLSTTPTIYQQSTYAPSTDSRWMGSIAMDQSGDMALGYSVSSTSISPSVRYTGRLAGDPLGTLPQGEATLIGGSGSQTSNFNRWGDYSMMAIDPSDDCTFWYTQEYYTVTSAAGWQTRIGSFKYPGCGAIPYTTAPQGSWVGAYGADGYDLLAWNGSSDLSALPQSTLAVDSGAQYQWNTATADVRALQSPDLTSRRATTAYQGSQLRLHLTFNSAYSGTVHLYALDWDSNARRESITINDGSGPRIAIVGTAFNDGAWIHASITVAAGGQVAITVDSTAGANAVLSGVFLGGAGLSYTQPPQGNWVGTFGNDGYALLAWNGSNDLIGLPQSRLSVDSGARYQWSGSTSDARALQSPDTVGRVAAVAYQYNEVRLHLTFSSAYSGTIHLYAVDWDSHDRQESMTVDDGNGPRTAIIGTRFDQGVWVNAPLAVPAGGQVIVTVDRIAGANAVLSGIFLGGAGLSYSQAPQGDWVGTYGVDGYDLLAWNGSADLSALPQSSLILDSGARYQWNSATTDVRALQSPDLTNRRATTAYQYSELRLHLTFNSTYTGTIHIYAVDWDSPNRQESISINDGSGPRSAIIGTSFSGGAWVSATINVAKGGQVTITVDSIAGANAVLSGVFLG